MVINVSLTTLNPDGTPPLGGGRERFLIYLHDISCEYLLERLSLILVSRETKGGDDDVTLVEPARRQVAQHGAHIFVFELRAQLLQHNVALLDLARLLFA